MNKLLSLSLLGVLLASLIAPAGPALARDSVDENKAVKKDGYVRINIVRGELKVIGWDKPEVQVQGQLDEQTREFIFEVRGNETVVAVKLPNRLNNWCCDNESDLTVRVPKGSNVVVSVVSTDTEVENIHGGLEVGGVSGDIRVRDVTDRIRVTNVSGEIDLRKAEGRIRVKTVSGDIDAGDLKGPALFHSVSGSIFVNGATDELDLETVSGDIEVTADKVKLVRGHSVSGDVELSAKLLKGASVEFDSMSGSVRLRLGGELAARFDVQTGSGSIRNRITKDKPRSSKYVGDETLRFTVGDGAGEVIVTSGSGDITLSRQ